MDIEIRKQQLLTMWEHEQVYKELYLRQPDVYDYQKRGEKFQDWDAYRTQYQKNAGEHIPVPEVAPSIMGSILVEQAFFPNQTKDVCLWMNARYCPPFWHHLRFIKIMYVLNGELLLNTSKSNTITLKKGNFVMVPPKLEHSVFSCHDDDIVVNIFLRTSTFEKTFSTLLTESNDLAEFFWNALYGRDESSIIWFQNDSDPRLDQLLADMFDAWTSEEKSVNFYLVGCVTELLSYALYHHRSTLASVSGSNCQNNMLPKILQYLRSNYNMVSLPSLAHRFQLSEEHLSRYIRRETGYSLSHLLREFRLKQSAQMLRNTQLSIEQIMLDVGYTDISYFYKVFKLRYHMTPNQYRKTEQIVKL